MVADALRGVDPVGARAAEQETNWHRGYLLHFRRLVEAGLTSADAARQIAADGLASLHDRMHVVTDGAEMSVRAAFDRQVHDADALGTAVVAGDGMPERELSVPYHAAGLRVFSLHRNGPPLTS